jgi:hypothetical protein
METSTDAPVEHSCREYGMKADSKPGKALVTIAYLGITGIASANASWVVGFPLIASTIFLL